MTICISRMVIFVVFKTLKNRIRPGKLRFVSVSDITIRASCRLPSTARGSTVFSRLICALQHR